MKKNIGLILLICLFGPTAFPQYEFIPLSHERQLLYENRILSSGDDFHTSVRPYRRGEIEGVMDSDSVMEEMHFDKEGFYDSWAGRKLFSENLINVEGKDYAFSVNPILTTDIGRDFENSSSYTFTNTRGAWIEGRLGEGFSFFTAITENQARFPGYYNAGISSSGIIPGWGVARPFKEDAYDYSMATGLISYTPNKFFNFSAGHGKQFLGEGYRSMFLSDAAFNYPYFRIETTFWNLKYINIWAAHTDLRPELARADVFAKKYTSMHYLSWNVTDRWNVNLFEGIAWGDEDEPLGLDVNFLNPVIMFRSVEYSTGFRGGNILMGIGSSYRIHKGLKAYFQWALDDFKLDAVRGATERNWVNLFAWQVGAKYGDAFDIPNLFLLAEFNIARPHMFSHRQILTNWGHYNQPLAHLWGGNFTEAVLWANYRLGRWQFNARFNYGLAGLDNHPDENWGGDIYKSYNDRERDEGVHIGQGAATRIFFADLSAAWIVNPSTGLRIEAGFNMRREALSAAEGSKLTPSNATAVYFGLSTPLFNRYRDVK